MDHAPSSNLTVCGSRWEGIGLWQADEFHRGTCMDIAVKLQQHEIVRHGRSAEVGMNYRLSDACHLCTRGGRHLRRAVSTGHDLQVTYIGLKMSGS